MQRKSIGLTLGYYVYRMSDGYLEGFKSIGKIKLDTSGNSSAKRHERVVTTAKTMEEFYEQVKNKSKRGPRVKEYDPYEDPKQLKIRL